MSLPHGVSCHFFTWKNLGSFRFLPPRPYSFRQAQYQLLDSAGLSVDALNTWKISPLEFDQIMNRSAAGFIIGPANHGIRCERFVQGFVDEVELGDLDQGSRSWCLWPLFLSPHAPHARPLNGSKNHFPPGTAGSSLLWTVHVGSFGPIYN